MKKRFSFLSTESKDVRFPLPLSLSLSLFLLLFLFPFLLLLLPAHHHHRSPPSPTPTLYDRCGCGSRCRIEEPKHFLCVCVPKRIGRLLAVHFDISFHPTIICACLFSDSPPFFLFESVIFDFISFELHLQHFPLRVTSPITSNLTFPGGPS